MTVMHWLRRQLSFFRRSLLPCRAARTAAYIVAVKSFGLHLKVDRVLQNFPRPDTENAGSGNRFDARHFLARMFWTWVQVAAQGNRHRLPSERRSPQPISAWIALAVAPPKRVQLA
jgi:hypothetical protein